MTSNQHYAMQPYLFILTNKIPPLGHKSFLAKLLISLQDAKTGNAMGLQELAV